MAVRNDNPAGGVMGYIMPGSFDAERIAKSAIDLLESGKYEHISILKKPDSLPWEGVVDRLKHEGYMVKEIDGQIVAEVRPTRTVEVSVTFDPKERP